MDKIFKATNKGGKGEIILYADIGGFFGIDSVEFLQAIRNLGNVSSVDLRVSSEGGSVLTAVDMYNAIRRHPAAWTAHIDGLAASAASWLVLAASKVRMADNAQYMIHRASGIAMGTADDMRKTAGLIEDIESTAIVKSYVDKIGMTDSEIMDLMDAETWMNADKAKEFGFIDQIDGSMQMAANAQLSGRYQYAHPPSSLTVNAVDKQTPKLQAVTQRLMKLEHDLSL